MAPLTFPDVDRERLATITTDVNAPTNPPVPKGGPTLVENVEPEQITADGSFYEDWLPSRADLYPITRETNCLLPSVTIPSHTSITPITVGNENGFRILARDKHNIRQATEILEYLGVCWDAIAEPERKLIIHAPGREDSIFRIMSYSGISSTASWRFLTDPGLSDLVISLKALVVCYFDPIAKTCDPLMNIRDPPKLHKKLGAVTSQHWKAIESPEIGKSDGYDPADIDKHMAPKLEEKDKEKHPFLSATKAKDVDTWIAKDAKTDDTRGDALQGRPDKGKSPASLSATPEQARQLKKERIAIFPGGEAVSARYRQPVLNQLKKRNPFGPYGKSRASKEPIIMGLPASLIDIVTEYDVRPVPSDAKPNVKRNVKPLASETDKIKANIRALFPSPTPSAANSPSIEALSGDAKMTATKAQPETSIKSENLQAGTSVQGEDPPSENRQYSAVYLESLRQTLPANIEGDFQDENSVEREYWMNRTESRPNYWQRSAVSHGRDPFDEIADISSGGVSGTYHKRIARSRSVVESKPATLFHWQPDLIDSQPQPSIDQISRSGFTDDPGLAGNRESNAHQGYEISQSLDKIDYSRNKDQNRGLMMKFLQETIEKEHVPRAPVQFFPDEPVTPQKPRNDLFLHPDLIDLSPVGLVSSPLSGMHQSDEASRAEVTEKVDSTEETQTREFHETMFHQRPANQGLDAAGQENKPVEILRPSGTKIDTSGTYLAPLAKLDAHLKAQQEQDAALPSGSNATLPAERAALAQSTRNLVSSMWPILDKVRSFPGVLTLEIQLGLLSVRNLTASMQEKELTFKDIQGLFFSRHDLEPPRTLFVNRLTSTPSDIDYLIALEIDGKPVFEQFADQRGIRYILQCRTSSGQAFIISIDHRGTTTTRYGRVELGSVSISFPDRVWDASAAIQGYTHFFPDQVEGLQEAVEKLANSLWLDPGSERIQMLLRIPDKGVMTLQGIVVERRTNHRWISDQSKNVYLKVTETQVLAITPSVLDPNVLVARADPHEEMVKLGKYWWQASVMNPMIEKVLQKTYEPKPNVKPGTPTESWNVIDLLGSEAQVLYPEIKLSPLGARIGQSGIPAMFRLARILVQNIDAIGYYNKGPTAYLKRNTSALGESKTGSVLPSRDLKNAAVAKWIPSAEIMRKKHKW
ncbi:hypothetical protein N7541_001097 [Penicillium brevicompactum]|uniref:Uncharacterized protein n=1 Tax=Penicillium brevicompactum TaxID=5074 RepID=A0A9W9RVK4_PENBR|nr:hypothetical protein N7541_001097 [Penicillium brevicompactum]